MKRSGIVAVSFVGLSMLAVGCGSTGVSTTPAQIPSTGPTPTTPSTSSTPSATKAGVGDTIDLSGQTSGDVLAVTVVKVVDPDSANDGFSTPAAGDHYVSVQFRLSNIGKGSYQDDPFSDITAKDASGQSMQQDFMSSTTAGAQLDSSTNLAPGDQALGFETFDVPNGDKIAQVQYALSGGLYGNAGEWQIGNGQALPSAPPPSTGPAAPPTAHAPATTSANGAQAVVEQYFAAINAGNYALAWSLGGMNIQQGSYDSFVQGFAGTSSDTVTVVSASGNTVTVQLDAAQTDGTHKYFAGTYTVKDGVIVSADIH
jgi:hypothetical protein